MIAGRHQSRAQSSGGFAGWRVAFLCFVAQNCALGLGYGSFGPLLASTERHFGITRPEAAVGMSLLTLGLSLFSPFAGGLLQRRSVRLLLIFGASISAIGYWGLAAIPSFRFALVMYVLIGAGICLLAILGPLALVTRWFVRDRARVLSFVNLPVALFLTPFVVAELLPLLGRAGVLFAIGCIFLALVPMLMFVADDPARIGQSARGMEEANGPAGAAPSRGASATVGARVILTSAPFWLLSFGIGVMAGSGVAFVVHIVPFGLAQGMSLPKAAGLLSIYGGSGIVGTLLFGWICDKAGSQLAVLISATCLTLLWAALTQATGDSIFIVAAAIGICGVPILTFHGAALSELFGAAEASRAMGFSYAIKLPFLLTFAPFVGILFLRFDGYRPAFLMMALIMATAALAILTMLLLTRSRRRAIAGMQFEA